MVTIQDQTNLEKSMVDGGIDRFNSALNKMMEKELESTTKHGRAFMSTQIDKVAEAIEQHKSKNTNNRSIAKRKLGHIDSKVAAYIAMLAVVDTLTKKTSYLRLAANIGKRLEDQIRLQTWIELESEQNRGDVALNVIKKANEKTRSGRKQKRKGLVHKMNKDGYQCLEWTNKDRVNTGKLFIAIIIMNTGIIERPLSDKKGKKNTSMYVVPTAKTLKWVENFNAMAEVARPRYTPTIIPPKDWTRVWGGGFYADVINNLPLVRIH